jgi:hypothetical protein
MTTAEGPATAKRALLERCCGFVSELGIRITRSELTEKTFLPGLEIRNGELVLDEARLSYPGDLLHEAGHIAVSTPEQRVTLLGNVVEADASKAGDELAVMLWTYAACTKLALPANVVFHDCGYKGESAWLLQSFQRGEYIGLPLLVWMGLAHPANHPEGFPRMIRWLRSSAALAPSANSYSTPCRASR